MNTTKNISIGGYAFIVEEDAYQRLHTYTEAVKRNLAGSPGADEIMADVEGRIAEILRENMAGREVVKMDDVAAVIRRMGEPEVYVQDDAGNAQKSSAGSGSAASDGEPGDRRLFRDPDAKILGGVCGGLGAYAGIDPVWFRLAFAVAFLFYSTGGWLYIILWIIMPEAKTSIQKLQMRGKRPDLKNIEDSVRSEFDSVGKNINRMANDKSIRDGARRVSDTASDVFTRLFGVFGKVLEVALKFFAGIVAGLSLVFLGILIFSYLTGTTSIHYADGEINVDSVGSIIPHLFETRMEGWVFYSLIFIFLVIPTVALLANSIRYLANIQTKTPKWLSLAAVVVWVLSLAGLLYSGLHLGWDFMRQATGKTEQTFDLPQKQTLYLRAGEEEEEEDLDLAGLFMSDVRLDIREAKDSVFTLRIFREASGRTHADADRRQRAIEYEVTLKDSVLTFPRLFRLPEGEVLRRQSVAMELRVPHNRRIYLEHGMENVIYDVDNIQNTHDSEMPGQFWIMSERGLTCEGCYVPAPDTLDEP